MFWNFTNVTLKVNISYYYTAYVNIVQSKMPQTSGFWIQYIKDESGRCQGHKSWKDDVDYVVI